MSGAENLMHALLESAGFEGFTREHRFAPPRRWRFDFAWPELKLALEIEGATWTNGRHSRGSGFEADCEKYNEAAALGWHVLRVPTGWVTNGRALAALERWMEQHGKEE